ncbi:hypothetical protein VNO78_18805 [Psophocarpus tetragonolobus]|uniref:DUF674 domain-containing protein n=1 Tax=Psophocarpus tetragonolobus TaxID=3891 RepID=A0AAN9S863_PSOTE
MASSSSSKLTMKLLIDTKHEKVLFAEASKAVVDFLFNLLCLPLSSVIRLLGKNDMVGCLGNLYQSVENLNESYMQPNQYKDLLLKPRATISSPEISGLLPAIDGRSTSIDNSTISLYMCPHRCYYYVTYDNTTPCPNTNHYAPGRIMNSKICLVGSTVAENAFPNKSGFVKEVVTYTVMDDLVIQPMSTISSITLLNKFNVKEVGTLQEKVVELGMTEGVNMLKASLQSKLVLTTVFLKNNKGT